MKLKIAVLCPECDEVYCTDFWTEPGTEIKCPFCGNSQYLRLDTVLGDGGREETPPEEQVEVDPTQLFLTLQVTDLTTISGKKVDLVNLRINGVDKTFKISRRYFRYNFSLQELEEKGPKGDEPCYDKKWYSCEEVKDEKA